MCVNNFLFGGLEEEKCNDILKSLEKPVKIERLGELYKYGSVGLLLEGTAKIVRKNEIGKSVTMRTIGENEIFGVASVFGEWSEGFSSIIAKTPCKVLYITEEQLKNIFTENPNVAFNYIYFLTDRIRFLNKKIDTFTAESSEEKLYEYLVSHADGENRVKIDFGMAELARRLKIGRSSLYRGIENLEKGNLIKRDKNLFIIR